MSGPPLFDYGEPVDPELGEILSELLSGRAQVEQARRKALEARAQTLSARELCRQLAPLLGVSDLEAFNGLSYLPGNMIGLLESPQGWSAIASYVAAELNAPLPDYAPTLH